jgi:hypothetical protein
MVLRPKVLIVNGIRSNVKNEKLDDVIISQRSSKNL